MGLLIDFSASDNSFGYHYSYDPNQNLIRVDHKDGACTRKAYDINNRLIQEILSNDLTFSYTYDGLDRPLAINYPDGSRAVYTYDAAFLKRIDHCRNNDINSHHYQSYDLSGHLLQAINTAGDIIEHQYDILGRLKKSTTRVREEKNIQYDSVGNLLQKELNDSQGKTSCQYAYDNLYQLIQEEGVGFHRYSYDSLNNRLEKDNKPHLVNDLNQLESDGIRSFVYDRNGNLIQNDNYTFTYDALDRLIAIERGNERYNYKYDELNRRVSKTSFTKEASGNWQKRSTDMYLYTNLNEVGTWNNGVFTEFRVLGLGQGAEIGAGVLFELNNKAYCPVNDQNGNVVCLVDILSKETVESYRYTAYGEEQIFDASNKATASPINPWRFASKRKDAETTFIYFGLRYYDPSIGRWITSDPAGYGDGPNLYAYVHNNPLRFFDRLGLEAEMVGSVGVPKGSFKEKKKPIVPELAYLTRRERHTLEYSKTYNLDRLELPSIHVGFVCGIMNSSKECLESGTYISDLISKIHVQILHNQSRGFPVDIIRSFCELAFHYRSKAVKMLEEDWAAYFKANPNGYLLQYCHSEGAIITRNAILNVCGEAWANRIIIVAIAPGAYIDGSLCGGAVHYVSPRDFVHRFDFIGARKFKDSIVKLDVHPDAKLWDHSFNSPTYKDAIESSAQKFINKYGS